MADAGRDAGTIYARKALGRNGPVEAAGVCGAVNDLQPLKMGSFPVLGGVYMDMVLASWWIADRRPHRSNGKAGGLLLSSAGCLFIGLRLELVPGRRGPRRGPTAQEYLKP